MIAFKDKYTIMKPMRKNYYFWWRNMVGNMGHHRSLLRPLAWHGMPDAVVSLTFRETSYRYCTISLQCAMMQSLSFIILNLNKCLKKNQHGN